MEDGQLDECTLTFRDIGKICSAFETVLQGVSTSASNTPALSRAQHQRTKAGGAEDGGKTMILEFEDEKGCWTRRPAR
ncbi:MAG: hypothetical protein ACLUI3_10840 [Christensenellales bacterium]